MPVFNFSNGFNSANSSGVQVVGFGRFSETDWASEYIEKVVTKFNHILSRSGKVTLGHEIVVHMRRRYSNVEYHSRRAEIERRINDRISSKSGFKVVYIIGSDCYFEKLYDVH